ncbi:MAG: hypothetical protein U0W24_19165 [Bacteroidales bacterium]
MTRNSGYISTNKVMKLIISFDFLFILNSVIYCQSSFDQIGGRSIAVSGASVTYQDVWSQYHNQAGMAYLKGINAGIAFQNEFLMKELSLKSVVFSFPTKSGVFGLNYSNFGYSKYNENKLALAFAKRLGNKIAVGIQLDYQFIHIDGEYGNTGNAFGEIGLLAEPFKNFLIGAHIYNFWHARQNMSESTYFPTVLKLGTSYLLYEKAQLSIEFVKDLEQPLIFKSGIELELVKDFMIRAGISTNPNLFSFGLGYSLKPVNFCIAFSKHPVLGYSPAVSMVYTFRDRI